jgi:hypothetical protein
LSRSLALSRKGLWCTVWCLHRRRHYDRNNLGLVDEESIRALEASVKNELGSREAPHGADGAGEEVDEAASGGYKDILSRTLSPLLVAQGAAMPVLSPARVSALRRDADSALRSSPSSSLLGSSSPLESSLWGPSSSRSVPDEGSLGGYAELLLWTLSPSLMALGAPFRNPLLELELPRLLAPVLPSKLLPVKRFGLYSF